MNYPARLEHLNSVDNISKGWENVKLAIRPECRDDIAISKAQIAINVGLNDAAINYIWNLTINDLYKKIITYGIEYFSSAINWEGKPLKTLEDLKEVKDHQVITGAFVLGIIVDEAHFFLQQCREIRNNFSTAHYPMGELDKFECFNFIKNCIKYVLTFDPPAPGLQIKDLIENLSIEELDDIEEIKLIVEAQSQKIHGPILHNLFSNFIKSDCDQVLKHNVKLLAPYLWKIVNDDVKSAIGHNFVSLKDLKGRDAAAEALEFLKIVGGVEYIPEGFKEIIFKKQAQFLIDAHLGWDNFYNEPSYAKDLLLLGAEIPIPALFSYVKAITISYVGNQYGISVAAQKYNEKMIQNLAQSGIRTLINILKTDLDIIRELSYLNPAKRLSSLMELIKDKTILPKQKDDFKKYSETNPEKLRKHFDNLYWKLVKK